MELDDLNDAWRRLGEKEGRRDPAVLERVRQQGYYLSLRIHRRDGIETAVGFLLVPIFGWLALATPHLLSRIGAGLLALSCLLIPLRFRAARRPAPAADAPLVETLRAEWERVTLQRNMLRQIGTWYAAPLWIGVTLFMAGPLSLVAALAVAIGTAALFLFLVFANRAVVRIELDPWARELRHEIEQLDQDLRPPGR